MKKKNQTVKPRGYAWVYAYDLSEIRTMYTHELAINKNKLEMASLQQATVFERWYAALEDVEADISDEEGRKDRYIAKFELRLRDLHPDWKEGHFKAAIAKSEKVKVFNKRLSLMRRYRGKLKGAVESARQRKSMIQTLKDLYTSNYWDKTTPGGTPYGKTKKGKNRGR